MHDTCRHVKTLVGNKLNPVELAFKRLQSYHYFLKMATRVQCAYAGKVDLDNQRRELQNTYEQQMIEAGEEKHMMHRSIFH